MPLSPPQVFIVGGLEYVCILLIILAMAAVGQVSGRASQACQDANDFYAAMGMENPNPCHDVVGAATAFVQAFLVIGLILCLLNAILCFVLGYKSWKAKTAIMNLNAARPKRPKNTGESFRFMGESKAVGPAHSGDTRQDGPSPHLGGRADPMSEPMSAEISAAARRLGGPFVLRFVSIEGTNLQELACSLPSGNKWKQKTILKWFIDPAMEASSFSSTARSAAMGSKRVNNIHWCTVDGVAVDPRTAKCGQYAHADGSPALIAIGLDVHEDAYMWGSRRPKRPKNTGASFRFMGESKGVGPAHSGDAPQETAVHL